MTKKQMLLASLAALLVVSLAALGMNLLMRSSRLAPAAPAAPGAAPEGAIAQTAAEGEEATRRHIKSGIKAGDTDPATGRKILYYHDPMVPGNKFDKPAKSPFMDMMLVPVYAGGDGDQGKVSVSPRVQQNLGVRTAIVSEVAIAPQLSVVGNIAFNERDQSVIQARASGYVERLHVRATLDKVSKGQALAELYVPDWVAAQQEFLAVRRLEGPGLQTLVEGARSRMRLAGMTDQQIRGIESSGQANPRTVVLAPAAGLVTEVAVREGMAIMPGATLFRINGFTTVWANAEVPEGQAGLVRRGAAVQAQAAATPGVTYPGRVEALLPEINATTRTLKARVELSNPRGQLVPGMFVTMNFTDVRSEKSLVVPTEAVIYTGKRTVVILAEDGGRFRPVDVQTGTEAGGQTQISKGLQAGQRVVVSSQFLIDSEASLRGVEARLNNESSAASAPAPKRHESEAKIEAITDDSLTLSHGPIPTIKWGAMTMDFKRPAQAQMPRNLKVGDRVAFEFHMGDDGLPQLTRVAPLSTGTAAAPSTPATSAPAGRKP